MVNEVLALRPVQFSCGGCRGYERCVISFVALWGVLCSQLLKLDAISAGRVGDCTRGEKEEREGMIREGERERGMKG